ncbi:macrolide transporter subunit MacA [Planctomycetales bacterium]|nr:macrolide transporter subunit MacA [Planctomycetales bacterium]
MKIRLTAALAFLNRHRRAAIVVALLLVGGVWAWRGGKSGDAESFDIKQFVPDQIVKVRQGNLRRAVSASGKIVPRRDVTIKCKAGGQIIELPFDVSDRVQAGDVLVRLDPVDENRNVRQAKINLQIAENNLATAKLNEEIATARLKNDEATATAAVESARIDYENAKIVSERNRQLFGKKLLSQENLDTTELAEKQAAINVQNRQIALDEMNIRRTELELKKRAVADADANLETKKLALSDAEQRLIETTVKAPTNGVVSALNAQIGQMVSSATVNTGGGTEIMTISDLDRLFADVEVDESEIAGIEPGLRAEIVAESNADKKFAGITRRIYAKGTRTRGVVNFTVRIEVLDPDLRYLRPEMTANAEIILAAATDALLIPAPAVRREGEQKYVLVQAPDGKEERRDIVVGIENDRHAQVLSGLQKGEAVVISVSSDEARWVNNALNPNVMTQFSSGRGVRRAPPR